MSHELKPNDFDNHDDKCQDITDSSFMFVSIVLNYKQFYWIHKNMYEVAYNKNRGQWGIINSKKKKINRHADKTYLAIK